MSFLRRLLGKQQPEVEPHHAVVMVLLPGAEAPDGRRVIEHLREHFADALPAVSDVVVEGSALTATIPGGALGLLHMPAPVPAEGLAGPVAVAWHWEEADEVVAAHRSHVIVHVGSTTLGRIEVRLLITRLAASVLAVAGGTAVYVGDAMLVRSAADYSDDANSASPDNLPILSWIGFNLVQEDDGRFSAYTTGMGSFGFLELEAHDSALQEAELLGTVGDLVNYQLTTGKVLKDGDTFGASAEDRTRVSHEESRFIPEMTVAVLEMGG